MKVENVNKVKIVCPMVPDFDQKTGIVWSSGWRDSQINIVNTENQITEMITVDNSYLIKVD